MCFTFVPKYICGILTDFNNGVNVVVFTAALANFFAALFAFMCDSVSRAICFNRYGAHHSATF